jgi:SAM-dependent methyltransferase
MLPNMLYHFKEFVFTKFPCIKKIFAFQRYTRDQFIAYEASLIPSGSRVLDAGAGSSPYKKLFAHCYYIAQDLAMLSPEQLLGRKGYGELDIISDCNRLPIRSGSIDVVVCTEVLEHIANPVDTIKEFSRVLREGGVLLLTAPLRSGLHQEPYHFYGGFTPYWYKRWLSEAGFVDIQIKPVGGLFKMYGESSLHIAISLAPWSIRNKPFISRIILFFIWVTTLPWFMLFCPILCYVLDNHLPVAWGTVGYLVKAKRANIPSSLIAAGRLRNEYLADQSLWANPW